VRYVIKNIIQGRHTIKELGIIFAVERAEANIKLVKTIPHGKIRELKNVNIAVRSSGTEIAVGRNIVLRNVWVWGGRRDVV